MTPLSPDINNRLVEAYLGYRLNNAELVELVNRSTAGENIEDTFHSFSARDTDWRGKVSPEALEGSLEILGLREQFQNLPEDRVWSAEDRAVYRRLSQPEFDPPTDPPGDYPAPLDAKFAAEVKESFSAWDRDGNIRLERQELDYLMSGGAYGEKRAVSDNPEKAAVLATLMKHYNLLSSAVPVDGPGVSVGDINAWAPEPGNAAAANVNFSYSFYRDKATTISVEGKPVSKEDISPEHVFQGVVGSCVLLSTIIGSEAADLRSMLAEAGEGALKVTFADGPSELVNEPTLAERLHHSRGADGDRWPAVIELAAAQRLVGEGKRPEDGLRGAIEGIDPEFAIPALTGKPADKRSIDELTVAETRDLLVYARAEKGPVICGSRPVANGDFINVEELHNGIANGHCYAIKSFDAKTDTVTLQNPWHKGEWIHANDGADDGVFEMPLKDFYSSFRWVTFAKRD